MALPVLVIDTNMVYTDRLLRLPHWVAAAEAVKAGQVEIVFSEVVVRETGRHLHHAEKAARKEVEEGIRKVLDNLEDSLLGVEWPDLQTLPSVRELRESTPADDDGARARFRSRLTELGFRVIPVPSPPHDQLVDWSLRAHPPFDTNENGYRDALIWWTLVELAKANPQRLVVFVSNDNDFLQKEQAVPKDAAARHLAEHRLTSVRFARSITDALEIAHAVQTTETAAETVATARIRELLEPEVHEILFDLVGAPQYEESLDGGRDVLIEGASLPAVLVDPTVDVITFPSPLLAFVREGFALTEGLPGGALTGTARTQPADLGLAGFVAKADYHALSETEQNQLTVVDPDWSEHMMRVFTDVSVVAEVEFSIDPIAQRVLSLTTTRFSAAPTAVDRSPEAADLGDGSVMADPPPAGMS